MNINIITNYKDRSNFVFVFGAENEDFDCFLSASFSAENAKPGFGRSLINYNLLS